MIATQGQRMEIANLGTALKKETQKAEMWADKEGKSRAEVATISAEKEVIKKVYEAEIDSIRKSIPGIGRNGRNLIESTNIRTETRDSVILKTVYDTIVVNGEIGTLRSYQYSDRWASFKLDPLTNSLEYATTDSLSIVKYNKKNGFLKKRSVAVQVISHNPKSTITGLTQFEIKQEAPRINLGFQVGYGITNNGLSPYAGIGLNIRLWKKD